MLNFFQICNLIRDCFVTGKWEKGKDAANLLAEDDEIDDDDGLFVCFNLFLELIYWFLEEVFGDFEDLETGEKGTEEMDYDGKNFDSFIFYFFY